MKTIAPGKVILSGEHAVVYDCPALGMAINRYISAEIALLSQPFILFELVDLPFFAKCSASDLLHTQAHWQHQPHELAQAAVAKLLSLTHGVIPQGLRIRVSGDLPRGSGLGSSAATILCIMQAVATAWQLALTQDVLLALAQEVEHLQHGRSSGMDLRIISHGGCLYRQGGQYHERPFPSIPLYLVHTGMPEGTTSECVQEAARPLRSHAMRAAFTAVTEAMDAALQRGSKAETRASIAENHRLLQQLGVVPAAISDFIMRIEQQGGAAKICGAGAIRGQAAGAVLVASDSIEPVLALCEQAHYSITAVSAGRQ